jgi:hypothetical protein
MFAIRIVKISILINIFLIFNFSLVFSQTPGINKSILLSAEIHNDPPVIKLSWQPIEGATAIKIYRKFKTSTSWGNPISGNLPSGTILWTDSDVKIGTAYEYCVSSSGTNTAFGYIYAGIDIPEAFYRGKILLVFDTISTKGLDLEIERWVKDVEGDGYDVIEIPVNQNDAVTSVKEKISDVYILDKQNIKSIFLLGRVPVPYSGVIVPDGHPDHQGAWPCDGYYAELDGTWSDKLANNTSASSVRNQNIKGDGKFDQNTFPSDVDLMTGRVDMHNLPSFPMSETELLRKYLNKNHAFRNKLLVASDIAVIDDEFTGYPEGFSASGWRSYSSVCSSDKIQKADYLQSLKEKNHLWSYGCGAGNFTNCSGVVGINNFVNDSLNGIFTMLFGSYFGDWDNPQDNLLRAALAGGTILTNVWSGRPYWYFHHMGLGENIGYSAKISMNNSGLYDFNNNQRGVHMALMGDPTLRAHIVAPPTDFNIANIDSLVVLSWKASEDSVLGYNIYRKNDSLPVYEKINPSIISDTFFIDSCLVIPGNHKYMLRAVKLEKTNCGTYYNMSTGISDTLFNSKNDIVVAKFDFEQDGYNVSFFNQSQNAKQYLWSFDDGTESNEINPKHIFNHEGAYLVKLIAVSDCGSDDITQKVNIILGGVNSENFQSNFAFPNPVSDKLKVKISGNSNLFNSDYRIVNYNGALIKKGHFDAENEINVSDIESGFYLLILEGEYKINFKFIKL